MSRTQGVSAGSDMTGKERIKVIQRAFLLGILIRLREGVISVSCQSLTSWAMRQELTGGTWGMGHFRRARHPL